MIAALVLSAAVLGAAPGGAGEASAQVACSRWSSEVTPPHSIRVLIGHHVERVPFELYVARVVSSEWNNVHPRLRLAGALAVKQYGWWKAMRPRRSDYGCFDVHADTRDQIYREKAPPQHVWDAVRATWGWRLLRDGRLPMTGYRTGAKVVCARDIDGWHLFARSAGRCAQLGWSAERILERYYRARLVRS